MTIEILIALACSIIGLGVLPTSADEPLVIKWSDLIPVDVVEDPFEKLGPEQLQDLAHVARIRALIVAKKIEPNGDSAKEATEIAKHLKKSGIDIPWLLSQREPVRRLREIQATSVQPNVEGKIVQLAGFVVPLKKSGTLITEFLLVSTADSCSDAELPCPNQAVFVRSREGIPSQARQIAARVIGRIEAKETTHLIQRKRGAAKVTAVYAIVPSAIEVYLAKGNISK